jgi:hypothetical protein
MGAMLNQRAAQRQPLYERHASGSFGRNATLLAITMNLSENNASIAEIDPVEICGSPLARKTLLSFSAQAFSGVVALAAIPFIVRGLGVKGYVTR